MSISWSALSLLLIICECYFWTLDPAAAPRRSLRVQMRYIPRSLSILKKGAHALVPICQLDVTPNELIGVGSSMVDDETRIWISCCIGISTIGASRLIHASVYLDYSLTGALSAASTFIHTTTDHMWHARMGDDANINS